jgi:uncharacterized protein YjbI with pentapeptide repeats
MQIVRYSWQILTKHEFSGQNFLDTNFLGTNFLGTNFLDTNFLDRISKKFKQNFMKIRPVGAELFHADGRTDRHDKANSLFRNFANAPIQGNNRCLFSDPHKTHKYAVWAERELLNVKLVVYPQLPVYSNA